MAKKNRIPKKIAGIKIPKVMRRNSLIKGLLGSPAGRQVIAQALLAAASAAAAVLTAAKAGDAKKAGEAKKAGAAVAQAGEDGIKVAKRALKSAAVALTDSLGDSAKSALGLEDTRRKRQRPESRTH